MPFWTASNVYFNQYYGQSYNHHMIAPLAILTDNTGKNDELIITLQSKQDQVQQWLSENDLAVTTKQFKNSVHMRSLKYGFEFEFQTKQLYTFFAYFRSQKVSCFEFPLKFGINKGWRIKGAVMYLGEPPKKSNKFVQIIYPHLGLGLVFQGTYNNEDSLINYAYLYAPQGQNICAACCKQFNKSADIDGILYKKDLKVHECKCGIVKYCSLKCIKKHYGQHLIFCEEGQL